MFKFIGMMFVGSFVVLVIFGFLIAILLGLTDGDPKGFIVKLKNDLVGRLKKN